MKTWLIVSLFVLAAGAAAQPVVARVVDLDQPGALEALAKSNPQHFATLQRLVDRTMGRDEMSVERVIQTAGGKDFYRGNIIKTSYPAKAPLWFTLDETRYVLTVTVRDPAPGGKPR